MTLFILILALSKPTCAAPTAEPQLVSRPAGVTNNAVVTTRGVMINSIVEAILYSESRGSFQLIKPGSPEFPQAVTAALLELVVSQEADNFKVGTPTLDETQNSLAKVKAAVDSVAGWKEMEVSDNELSLSIARKAKAKKFIRFKTESTQVSITDTEAKDYFDKNKSKFGNLPFSQFRDNIKSLLAKQQLDSRLREWFEVLKKKYSVRNLELERKM